MRFDDMRAAVEAAPYIHNKVNEYGGALTMLGRVVGLGKEETDAGIPSWSIALICIGTGIAIGYSLRNQISSVVNTEPRKQERL